MSSINSISLPIRVSRLNKKSGTLIGQAQDAYNLTRAARGWYNDHTRWTITINSGDRLFDIARRWFTSEDSDVKPPRQLNARYGRTRNRSFDEYGDIISTPTITGPPVELFYDEKGERHIKLDGHRITVSLSKPDTDGPPPDGGPHYRGPMQETIYFFARSRDGQQAVVSMLEGLAADVEKRKPALHLLNSWGDWSRRDDLPARPIKSVALARGQMDRIKDDVQGFLNQESEYIRRGMPYHRGYMLHGPPGTGKTSVVRALAAHFGLDLWYAPLGDLDKDTKLLGLINQVRPGSILLLEDIDVFHSARSREDDGAGVSMAGLLNALDGVATPHGLITFMTTNDIDVIDPAILRAGRVDLSEEIGLPDKWQVAELYNYWYSMELHQPQIDWIEWTGSTADLVELFKQNLNSPTEALQVLCKRSSV